MEDLRDRDIARIKREFKNIDSVALMVLKGHMFIEEKFDEILEAHAPHPIKFNDIRLTFHQKLHLIRSLGISGFNNSIWNMISALNELRNKLAHPTKSKVRENKENKLRSLYLKKFPEESNESDAVLFGWAAIYCMGFLEECRKEALSAKRILSKLDSINSKKVKNK